ncbi:MAG: hypothetical protein BJ554DRAFT_3829 [Olpidium bornovanus]|uniref:60S acidic ribosomal protein P2 n=1 Tax=Olpidium bornovanus TaxID=278681 RepID=A0A8H7ZNK3_9FUNG|nr:MAG: hypothetical protein BJ554DRAFT_3829 [Olpidium bornovanus]
MKFIAAYMLLTLGGNASPKAADITKLLSAGGIEVDNERVNALIKELEGKSIADLIGNGLAKLASVPAGGAATSSGGAPAASGGAAAAPAAAQEVRMDPRAALRFYHGPEELRGAPVANAGLFLCAPRAFQKAEEKEESDEDMGFGLFD